MADPNKKKRNLEIVEFDIKQLKIQMENKNIEINKIYVRKVLKPK